MKLQRYADATLHDLVRVLHAAEALYGCMAEFPDDPELWGDHVQAFDAALESCPGTAAHYSATQMKAAEPPTTARSVLVSQLDFDPQN